MIANLWEVDDSVAHQVIPEFYARLGGTSPVHALAALQRDLARGALVAADGTSLDHPFYWAGLVAYGAGMQSVRSAPVSAPSD